MSTFPIAKTEHADTLLEIAFLMSAVDGRLAGEELVSFKDVVERVRGRKTTGDEIDALIARFADDFDKDAIAKRVRAIAPTLPQELREETYRVSLGLAFIDQELHEDESELMDILAAALGLSAERADTIAGDMRPTRK